MPCMSREPVVRLDGTGGLDDCLGRHKGLSVPTELSFIPITGIAAYSVTHGRQTCPSNQ